MPSLQRRRVATGLATAIASIGAMALLGGLVAGLLATRQPDLRDPAPVGAVSGTAAGPGMSVCGTIVVQPSSFPAGCSKGSVTYNNVRWASWGSRSAYGVGEYWITDLATGDAESYPVRLRLTRPALQRDSRVFSRLSVVFAGQHPGSTRGRDLSFTITDRGLTDPKETR